MTTLANLDDQGTGQSGVTWDTIDKFTFDISEMNGVVSAFNTANSTNYATYDTAEDNFEKLIHFVLVFCKIQNLILTNDSFNIKWTTTSPQTQTMGTRGSLSGRALTFFFPFSNEDDVEGDPDNLG